MYESVGGHVGFGLVVVVVADEILDGVLGKESPELLVELRGQRLVVDHDERRPVHASDGLRHRERLARAGHAEQHLMRVAAIETLDELADGARLVAGKLEVGHEAETVVPKAWELTIMPGLARSLLGAGDLGSRSRGRTV